MGESPLMRDGWAVLQPTLTAQPSRSSQRTGPAVLLFLPTLRALDFWNRLCWQMLRVSAVGCLQLYLCVWFRVASVRLLVTWWTEMRSPDRGFRVWVTTAVHCSMS
jgi:hypothetical protein